jgi:nucleotide-binding universal stress UspA family protein
MKVVVASDLSYRSMSAVHRGILLGAQHAADVVLLHVSDEELPAKLTVEAQSWAREAMAAESRRAVKDNQPTPTIHVQAGWPKRTIPEFCAMVRPDVLALGLHDRTKDSPFGFHDTTVGRLANSSDVPVLLVRKPAKKSYERAVIGVDFSQCSRKALVHAQRLVPGAELRLTHAYQVPFRSRFGTPEYLKEIENSARREMNAFIEVQMNLLTTAATHGRIVSVIREGLATDVLREEVDQSAADLLVIGTHGSGGLSQLLWGSVAGNLLERPPCDVLVVQAH